MSSSIKVRIIGKRAQIQTNVSQVQTNKFQCQRLCLRIDQLIDPVERLEHASSIFIRQETRSIIDNLLQCLDDCNNFIEKFKSSTECCNQEINEYENDCEKFEELNKRLSELGQDLCLGLNIQELFNQKQDREDQKQDLEELNKISQKLLQQNQEQYKQIDKIINQRFESLRYYIEEKLLNQLDLNQEKTYFNEKNEFLNIPLKDLLINEKPIGNGGFSNVYKGIWLTHHDQVAIKVLHINNLLNNSKSQIQIDFYQEISTMYKIRYEHIVTILGACIQPNFYAIIMEYMSLGSLYDVLHKKTQNIILSWLDRYSLTWQMAKSINYLHNLNPSIIHRDIKSMNFLMKLNGCEKHRFLLKVCDFGLAEIRHESLLKSINNSISFQIVGSLAWKAPELFLSHEKHTKQTDIYGLGITMWELATGLKPWNEYLDEIIIESLVKNEKRPIIPLNIPEEYKQVIEDAWNQDPSKRPTCFDLMERMRKQMKNITKIDELTTTSVNLHHNHQQNNMIEPTLTTNTDSTRISISVAEENRLTDRLSNIIISDHRPNEDKSIPNTSSSSFNNKQIESDSISKGHRFERSLSKSVEDLSSKNISKTNNLIRESHQSKSTTIIYRSIIGRTITSANDEDKDEDNHTQIRRQSSIITQDTDSMPLVYRF
ncbi:unnamed protein product [Rotaria sp. Silwood2]|nr:unnamed protein product [Rotaria sp. Silwood2]